MAQAVLFLPLVGALIAGLGHRWIGDRGAMAFTTVLLVISATLSLIIFYQVGFEGAVIYDFIFPWINVGDVITEWAIYVDTLTAVMLVVVTGISSLVHIYSIGYMSHDPHRARFFAYLSLFTFMMLALVTADNFLQLFFGWEGVGLASYLLIGFWYKKPSANAAAIKAFVVNRIGDFGLLLGICAIFYLFGSLDYNIVFEKASDMERENFLLFGQEFNAITVICLLLFMGAMGKSAQFFLHTWLPDAMEGPTPVSALIHAATMVTAGVFLVARCSPLFSLSPDALMVVTVIGATTAFFAATVAVTQNDIKRVVAYSTCSQLGYMFVALGLGAYEAGIFHLFTHAFFKALLFLSAGSVIHALSDEQDMQRMGGVKSLLPATYTMMLIGVLALTGLPLTAGYFSKDVIIEAAYMSHSAAHAYAFTLTLVAAFLTAFYSWRLIFLTFHGEMRTDAGSLSHVHESSPVMLIPLLILAIGSLFTGILFVEFFVGEERNIFWRTSIVVQTGNEVLNEIHDAPSWVVWSPTLALVLGFVLAWYLYIRKPDIPSSLARAHDIIYRFLLNKWYFDEIYDALFTRPALRLGRLLWKQGDGALIDGLGPDGIAARVLTITRSVVRLQTGYLYHYAFIMLIGIAALITWFMVQG
ncbi:MAG: NADH-quinone oxidoreductase subunit L [Parvularculales bacterium]